MLRIIHTADVHLGARHDDLGEQAAAQRERQFAAFTATIDLALKDKVDLFLIAGDLFDSNVQPKRSVERVAAQLKRLVDAKIRTVVIPGTHDCYDRASIYRAYDLKTLSGSTADDDLVTVLTPDQQRIHLPALDTVVHGPVFGTKRAPHSPLRDLDATAGDQPEATWRIGLVHGSVAIPGRTEHDDVVITTDEIAATNLDYLALGHWHSSRQGKAGAVTYAYAGAPEPVALDQDNAGKVLRVDVEEVGGQRAVTVTEVQVGKTTFEKLDIDAATVASQPALIESLGKKGDPDLVLDARIVGVRPDELDLHPDEIETALAQSFLKVRIRDTSLPALTERALPPPDTLAGAVIRDPEGRIAELEATAPDAPGAEATAAEAAELRDALRLGRLLLAGHEVAL
jgi:DNA repair exonuclease SbcCD nuclease subunit